MRTHYTIETLQGRVGYFTSKTRAEEEARRIKIATKWATGSESARHIKVVEVEVEEDSK